MIVARFNGLSFSVIGHANYANTDDIVCAGVSAIVNGALNWFSLQDCLIEVDSGKVLLKVICEEQDKRQYLSNLIELIKIQLQSIALNPKYSQFIKIIDEKEQTNDK